MKNNIFFVYYLDKGTKNESMIKDILYIIPYSQFIKKYNKNKYTSVNLDEKEEYILIDRYQSISCNHRCIISYKKHSLKNIMTNSSYTTVQLITFSKKTKIEEIVDEIFPHYYESGDNIKKAKDKVTSFIIEAIKEYEK